MGEFDVVVKALIENRDKYLILKQKIKGKELYDLPGGKVNFKENLLDALKREVKEETKLTIEIIKPIGVWHFNREISNNSRVFCFTFLCKQKSGTLKISKDEDDEGFICYAKFLPKKDIKRLNIKQESLKRLLKEFFG